MIRQAVHVFSTLVAATALIAASASVAAAQTPKIEVAGGYAYLHETDLSVPAGWFASGGGILNDMLAIVGAVSGHYKTERLGRRTRGQFGILIHWRWVRLPSS